MNHKLTAVVLQKKSSFQSKLLENLSKKYLPFNHLNDLKTTLPDDAFYVLNWNILGQHIDQMDVNPRNYWENRRSYVEEGLAKYIDNN